MPRFLFDAEAFILSSSNSPLRAATFPIPLKISHWDIFKIYHSGNGTQGKAVLFAFPSKSYRFSHPFSPCAQAWHKEFRRLRAATRLTQPGLRQHFREIAGPKSFFSSACFLQRNAVAMFTAYVSGYKQFVEGNLDEFQVKKYKFCTLQYFHKELGLQ